VNGSRVAGLVTLSLLLLMAGLLGAPLVMLGWVALVVCAITVIPLVLRGGVGAQAFSNLARKRYDRSGWEAGWSRNYLSDRKASRRPAAGADLPPDLLPEDIEESKAWLRTLHSIRGLPERDQ
jgi:hypothetical protein